MEIKLNKEDFEKLVRGESVDKDYKDVEDCNGHFIHKRIAVSITLEDIGTDKMFGAIDAVERAL